MPEFTYNPFENNFTIYQPSEPESVTMPDYINDTEFDISDIAYGVTDDGVPLMKPERSVVIQNNPEYEVMNNQPTQVSSQNNPVVQTKQNTTSKYAKNSKISENQNIAMNFFMEKGLTMFQAAGIVGNLMHESGDTTLTKTTNTGDNGSAYGIAQWRLDRRTNLGKYAKSKGTDISDFITQLEFVWLEMEQNPSWLRHLKATTSVEAATKSFMDKFERPNAKYANLRQRIRNARSVLQ